MNAIQQLQAALDDYDDDELMRIIEDSDLDDVRHLRDLAQEAVDITGEHKDCIQRLGEMSAPARIVDKLRNYEYEKCGCGGAVEDIYALIHHIAFLEEEIEDLQVEAREKNAWEGRYNALLEECEASRPPEIKGGEASRGAVSGAVALDVNGYPWLCDAGGWRRLNKDALQGKRSELPPLLGPYTLIYPPRRNP